MSQERGLRPGRLKHIIISFICRAAAIAHSASARARACSLLQQHASGTPRRDCVCTVLCLFPRLLLAAHCLFQPSAFAFHRARRGPTPRLPACCVRLLRARAAACSVLSAFATAGRGAAGWLVLPRLPLLLLNSACSPQQLAFPLLLPARGQALAGAGFFHQRVQLPTHAIKT